MPPHRAAELVENLAEASNLPVGLYCQGSAGFATAAALEAVRAGADLIATAVYPVALTVHRVPGETLAVALAGLGRDTGVDVDRLWEASDLVDEHIGDHVVTPVAPRIAVRAAQYGSRSASSARSRRTCGRTPPPTGSRGARRVERIREEVGWPPLAAPIGQVLASQALLHVLGASRYGTSSTKCAISSWAASARPPADRPGRRARRRAHRRRGARGGADRPRLAPGRGGGPGRERGGAAPARALRRGSRAASARDPRRDREARTTSSAARSTRRGRSASATSCGSSRRPASARSRSRSPARA